MNVTSGYENNPDTNARAYTRGWFRTGDQGYVDADGYLYLQGRLKELINRGGEKIAPQEVDNVLMELAGIRQAVTFAVPHPTLGEDVATAVVLQSGANLSAVEMRQFLFGRLADFKVPSQIICVDEIPKGPTGKLQRIGLAEKLSNRLQAPRVAPRNDLEGAIATLFSDILAQEPPSIHDNFFTLGGDSLTGTQVINRLNAVLGLALPNVALFQHPTIAELAQAVLTEIDAESSGSTLALLEAVQDLSEEELQHLLYEG
jgi:acyl carrier protein